MSVDDFKSPMCFAGEMAYHGHRVKMYDNNLNALNSAYQRIEEDKHQLREDGLMAHQNFIVCTTTGTINNMKTVKY